MANLRARHWLAGITALVVLGVGWGLTATGDDGGTRSTEADLDVLGSVPSEDTAETETETGVQAEPEPDRLALDQESVDDEGSSTPSGPVAPYTGLPVEADLSNRSALVVKVDNHPRARPQTGLDQADIVFDLRAEGVTRFAAVFHSQVPDPVGPVRSSRTSDFDLLRGLDNPLYASSGANDYVAGGLRSLPIVELTNRTRGEYFRDFGRPAPHNLYVNGTDLYALAPDGLPEPEPWFQYRAPGEDLPGTATPAAGPVSISFTGSPRVTHTWDETVGGWLRTQDGAPHLTVAGDQLAPENVVIFVTDYGTSPADPISPEVRSTGEGRLVVLTDGHVIVGTWSRPTAEDKPVLLDGEGTDIALTPGRTWVLLPEDGQVGFAPDQVIEEGRPDLTTP